jgi:colicin import membrane protein
VARKLKTYLTSLGFFDQAVVAPSMKAPLEAWGARSNLFHQGVATGVNDSDIVEATMAKPGISHRDTYADGSAKRGIVLSVL